jgi:DNA adenine methylase
VTTYDGGKNGAGVWQTIINQMPPHRVYIEAFLGSGAVLRRKRPAVVNIGIEIDPITIAAVKPNLTAVDLVQANALEWLADYPAGADVLIYADPPYLRETRRQQSDLYRHEFASDAEHVALLELAQSSPALWIISGYWSRLYADKLKGWRTVKYQAQSRVGMREEWLWCNFSEPVRLHDYRAIGANKTERQRIKRKKLRWREKLSGMSALERNAVFEACQEVQAELSRMPAAQLISSSQDPQTRTAARTVAAGEVGSDCGRRESFSAAPLPCL